MPPRHSADGPTAGEMLEQVADLSVGGTIVLLPLLATALPGVVLLLVLPAVLVLAAAALPVAVFVAIAAPPYLLVRWLRRRLRPDVISHPARPAGAPAR